MLSTVHVEGRGTKFERGLNLRWRVTGRWGQSQPDNGDWGRPDDRPVVIRDDLEHLAGTSRT